MSCTCQVCKDINRWKDVIKNGTASQRYEVFEEMFSRIEEAETDQTYYQEVLSGRWPGSVEILERALSTARNLHAPHLSVQA